MFPLWLFSPGFAWLRIIGGMGDVRNEIRIILRACWNLNHCDANSGRKELIRIRARVGLVAVLILHHEVHLLDALAPDNGVVLPERFHRHVFVVDALLFVGIGSGASVAVSLPVIRYITKAPLRWLAACGPVQNLRADMYGAISIVDWAGPIHWPLRID